ncbi:MAG: hypothetical protein JJE07_06025, partial [Flavobacteriaceae bacterium]|nr:hypothetical protein [Flavobacteriaceae bacterium]
MKYLLTPVFFLFAFFTTQAQVFNSAEKQDQIADPITWDARLDKQNDSIYNLVFTAKLEKGWHLYSQEVGEDGPIPTTFNFGSSQENYELIGKTSEPEIPAVYDDVFGMDIKYFKNEVVFVQSLKILDLDAIIEVEVEFMVCNDEQCLPPDIVPFQISANSNKVTKAYANADVTPLDIEKTEALNISIQGWEKYQPVEEEGNNFLTIFLLGFVGGLIALLTPCVFPMIPLTVSFFTKGAKTHKKGLVNAVLYGVFIFLIYLLLSL